MTTKADPLINPLETHIGYWLRRTSARMIADLATRLGEFGLSVAEASVLVMIAANSGIRQSDLGRALGIQRANMAPLLIKLTGRGLIAREAAGGRTQSLDLTHEGRALTARIEQVIAVHENDCGVDVTPAERRQLIAILSKIMVRTLSI